MNADGSGQLRRLRRLRRDPDGSGELELAQSGRQRLWSPDGRTIAFLSARGGNSEVYVINADGLSEQRNLTRSPADESLFAWAPGRRK